MSELVSGFIDVFERLEPTSGPQAVFKALLLLFPDVPLESAPMLIDGTQAMLKEAFVEKGCIVASRLDLHLPLCQSRERAQLHSHNIAHTRALPHPSFWQVDARRVPPRQQLERASQPSVLPAAHHLPDAGHPTHGPTRPRLPDRCAHSPPLPPCTKACHPLPCRRPWVASRLNAGDQYPPARRIAFLRSYVGKMADAKGSKAHTDKDIVHAKELLRQLETDAAAAA
jgi:hypothetical protein